MAPATNSSNVNNSVVMTSVCRYNLQISLYKSFLAPNQTRIIIWPELQLHRYRLQSYFERLNWYKL